MSKRRKKKTLQANKSPKAQAAPDAVTKGDAPAPKTARRSKRQERRSAREQAKRKRNMGLIALVLVLAVAVVAVLFTQLQNDGTAQAAALDLADPVLGPAEAPITILEYEDFGCPSCRAWHRAGIRDAIIEKYGDSVQFVWKDFPVITPNSTLAAEAGQCAAAQGKFWEYHDYIYDTISDWHELKDGDLKRYASAVGLDEAAFSECLDGGQTAPKVRENLQSARSLRLRGTPSFVFNGEVLTGPPSFQVLESMILAALP